MPSEYDDEVIELKKFDMTSITCDRVVFMIGTEGKCDVMKNMLYYQRETPICTVISLVKRLDMFYRDIFPSLFVHDKYHPDILEMVLLRQTKALNKLNKERESMYSSGKIDPRIIFIMDTDDCTSDDCKDWTDNKSLQKLFLNSKHYQALCVMAMQRLVPVPASVACNVDYLFIMSDIMRHSFQEKKLIYDTFAIGVFCDIDMFFAVMDQCFATEKSRSHCLVLDLRQKKAFWYCAEQVPDFRVCSPFMWEQSCILETKKPRYVVKKVE